MNNLLSGFALDAFLISTYGWKDEGKAIIKDDVFIADEEATLKYTYDYVIGNVRTSFDTMQPVLPAGDPNNDYWLNVTSYIVDEFGGCAECHLKARVSFPLVISWALHYEVFQVVPPTGGDSNIIDQAGSAISDIDEAELAVHPEVAISTILAVSATVQLIGDVSQHFPPKGRLAEYSF
jgi:hypothetical protein